MAPKLYSTRLVNSLKISPRSRTSWCFMHHGELLFLLLSSIHVCFHNLGVGVSWIAGLRRSVQSLSFSLVSWGKYLVILNSYRFRKQLGQFHDCWCPGSFISAPCSDLPGQGKLPFGVRPPIHPFTECLVRTHPVRSDFWLSEPVDCYVNLENGIILNYINDEIKTVAIQKSVLYNNGNLVAILSTFFSRKWTEKRD